MTYDDLERVKKSVIRKYPIQANLAFKGIKIELSKEVPTAAVTAAKDKKGKLKVDRLLINPEFFDTLTFGQRVFVLAHEMSHIALKHFARSMDKPEKDIKRKYQEYCDKEQDEAKRKLMLMKLTKKYQNIWNIATDACINAFLKQDGLSFPYGVINPKTGQEMKFVDMPEGLVLRAEKIYDYLVEKDEQEKEEDKDKKKEKQQSGEGGGTSSESQSGNMDIDDIDIDDYEGIDSHDNWQGEKEEDKDKKEDKGQGQDKKEEKDKEEGQEEQQKNQQEGEEGKDKQDGSGDSEDEKEEEIKDDEMFQKELENRKKQAGEGKGDLKEHFKNIREGLGNSIPKPNQSISWKRLLVGSLEKEVDEWGHRRASRYMPNARIEERVYDTLPKVEIILDTSGSISSELLKGFLVQILPIFDIVFDEKPEVSVGCFSDQFYGFQPVRTKEEVAKFVPRGGGGTNMEAAVKGFTPDPGRKNTKIIFTDGWAGYRPQSDTPDMIWIVFGDEMNFTPKGRVIKVSGDEYNDIIESGSKLNMEEDLGRSR